MILGVGFRGNIGAYRIRIGFVYGFLVKGSIRIAIRGIMGFNIGAQIITNTIFLGGVLILSMV